MLEKIQRVYDQLSKDNLQCLTEIYADNIVFIDPMHEIQGLEALHKYFAGLYQNVLECRFQFEIQEEWDNFCLLTWTMHLKHPKLKKGTLLQIPGCSVLTLENDKIIIHRDYFDLGAMIYEHLPILGSIVKKIKKRL